MRIYRQGDVLLLSIATVPGRIKAVPRDAGRIVLAWGEVTGHAHAIRDREADLFSAPETQDRFLRVVAASGVELQHDEHETITLPSGCYVVRRQREYTTADMDPIQVAD